MVVTCLCILFLPRDQAFNILKYEVFPLKDNFQYQSVLNNWCALASTGFMTNHWVKFTNTEISMYVSLKELII